MNDEHGNIFFGMNTIKCTIKKVKLYLIIKSESTVGIYTYTFIKQYNRKFRRGEWGMQKVNSNTMNDWPILQKSNTRTYYSTLWLYNSINK